MIVGASYTLRHSLTWPKFGAIQNMDLIPIYIMAKGGRIHIRILNIPIIILDFFWY